MLAMRQQSRFRNLLKQEKLAESPASHTISLRLQMGGAYRKAAQTLGAIQYQLARGQQAFPRGHRGTRRPRGRNTQRWGRGNTLLATSAFREARQRVVPPVTQIKTIMLTGFRVDRIPRPIRPIGLHSGVLRPQVCRARFATLHLLCGRGNPLLIISRVPVTGRKGAAFVAQFPSEPRCHRC